MGGIKRKSSEVDIITRPELLFKINTIQNPMHKALCCFIYLTGARITEILGGIKKYSVYEGTNKDKIMIGINEIIIQPMKKESIEINTDDDLIRVHNVACLKRRSNIPRRTIPIIISQEKEFAEIFLEYYNTLNPGEVLFNIKRQQAWKIVNKHLGVYTHFLIHERCTHLTVQKDFTPLDLMKFRGWSSTLLASTYAHLSDTDLANKMRGKNKN